MITLRKVAGVLAVMVLGMTLAMAQPPAGDQAPPAPPSGADQAQPPAPPAGGDQAQGDRGPRGGRMDPAQMQQMMLERMKDQLQPTDEEWKAIEPLLGNVVKAQREATPMGGGRMGGRGGRGPEGGGPGAVSGIMPERQALQTALQDQNAKPEDIKAKLDAYKSAMAKKQAELKEARAKLREVLNVRQEAILVLRGTLD